MTFSDEDVALMLAGVAKKLEDGHISQAAASARLIRLLSRMDGTMSYEGSLKSQGRVSFGRSNEGLDGVAVFVRDWPADD